MDMAKDTALYIPDRFIDTKISLISYITYITYNTYLTYITYLYDKDLNQFAFFIH